MNEITQSLIAQANTAHAKCQLSSARLAIDAVDSINAARESGIYLISLDEQTPHGQWLKLFTDGANPTPELNFTSETARRYIKLAKALPEPITALPEGIRHMKDMLIAVSAISAPDGHGAQVSHEPRSPFQALTRYTSQLQGCLAQWMKDAPSEQWSPELRDQVKAQIEPLITIYESL